MFLAIVFAGFSQTGSANGHGSDTVCVPAVQVQNAIRKSDSLRIIKIELDSTRSYNAIMIRAAETWAVTSSQMQRLAELQQQQILALQADKVSLAKQRDLQQGDMTYYQNLLKKQKVKTALTAIGGVLCTVAVTILALKH